MPGTLFVVSTPIGNLGDLSDRARETLKRVRVVACEDTRVTGKLLRRFGIRAPLTSYHEHNERTKARQLVERLRQGESIALVSDAGTPTISDPGFRVIVEAIEAEVSVVPLPGASALTAVLSAGGLPTDRFVFEGFLPARQKERRERFQALRAEPRTLVFYEAPHRLKETLNDLQVIFGDREIVLARSHETGLDPAYVFGVIRQESRFLHDVRSSVGAAGLMQLMPSTARWMARKLALDFKAEQIADPTINVRLGTGYLKRVLEDFDGSQAMAAAAYNAGPNRPRRWREGLPVEPAIWAENIPFNETREYVKKVLSNAAVYSSLLSGRALSLKSWLGASTIGPRESSAPAIDGDLP